MHKSNVRRMNPVAELVAYRDAERERIAAGGCYHPDCARQATVRLIDVAGNAQRLCAGHASEFTEGWEKTEMGGGK